MNTQLTNYLKALIKPGIVLCAVVTFFILPHIAKSTSWYDSFNYRKQFTVNNPNATQLHDYQVRIYLHEGSGTDTPTNIYLNGNVLSNFNDIRFTTSDGVTNLNYWIESISAGVATVWVELDTLSASSETNFYVYYGNSSASSQSSGVSTFPYFDAFDTNGISGWTASEEDNNHAEETGQQSQAVTSSTYSSSPNSSKLHTYASCFSGPFDGVKSVLTASPGLSTGTYKVDFAVKLEVTGFRYSTSGVQRSRVRINGTEQFYDEISCNGINCTVEGDWSSESFTLTDTAVNSIAITGDSYDCASGNTYYDNIRIRQYTASEPTIVSVGQSQVIHETSQASPVSQEQALDCRADIPAGAPDLFQIDTTKSYATLYFTPLQDTAQYFISYSTQPQAEEHGAMVELGREGVQHFTVESLAPGTRYYFKVRGHNGCMPGAWSNIRKASTLSGQAIKGVTRRAKKK